MSGDPSGQGPILPNFLIIGERRSGTTSLAKWVEAHPDVYLHPRMDPAYFLDDALVGRREWFDGRVDPASWEESHSTEEYAALFEDGAAHAARGEKSADYLFWTPCHERIRAYLPDVRLVVSLRDPIERAWSHYWNEVGKGRETLGFEEAIDAEEERSRASDYARDHLSYVERGFYDRSLERLFRVFPRERVLVLVLEETRDDPRAALSKVFRFLDVDPDGLPGGVAGEVYNRNWTTLPGKWARRPVVRHVERLLLRGLRWGSRFLGRDVYERRRLRVKLESIFRETKRDQEMAQGTRERLVELYTPHRDRLEEMLGRRVSGWSW